HCCRVLSFRRSAGHFTSHVSPARRSLPRSPGPRLAMTSLICWFITSSPKDRKSTRLNSSHVAISYAVFCLEKKEGAILGSGDAVIGALLHGEESVFERVFNNVVISV